MATGRNLPINRGASAQKMAEEIFGDSVTVVGASYTGDRNSSGIYRNGDDVSDVATPGDTGVILSTGRVRDFTRNNGDPNRSASTTTNTRGENNNPDFNAAAGTRTYDASYIDVDFVPTGEVLTMQFVFASEEYPEFQTSVYQDFVGVWINGSQVDLVVGNGDTDPANINADTNQNLYLDNASDAYNTEMDGLTLTLSLSIPVIPDAVNSIRIGVADVADANYDSNLLIAADSVQTSLVAEADSLTMAPDATRSLDVLANDIMADPAGTLTITHINGQPAVAGQPVTLPSGQVVTLTADGQLEVQGDGDTETVHFTYGIEDGLGTTDVGIVTLNSVPCFVAGTRIETETGARPVEELAPGDLVLTRDEGLQPLRWIGRREVAAEGAFAPIRIAAGTLGPHGEIWLSPLHRVLMTDYRAELMFGEAEVLIAARDLVRRRGVRRVSGGTVCYVHLLFDRHQVVYSEGLATESFLPGPQSTESFDRATLDEIAALFPELDPETGAGYGAAARRMLKAHEAALLAEPAPRPRIPPPPRSARAVRVA
jgi:hypothetical protein